MELLPKRVDRYRVEFIEERRKRPVDGFFGARPMVVIENRELMQDPSERSARHLDLVLPEGVSYRPGDHLGVIPRNAELLIQRVAHRFRLDPAARLRIHDQSAGAPAVPTDEVMTLRRLLQDYLELQDPIKPEHVELLAEHLPAPERRALEAAAAEKSALDLLEEFPGCELPFHLFLETLQPLRPRYYSISSSPLSFDRILSITVGVLDLPARGGRGRFQGACSNYLARVQRGESIQAFVRRNPAFHMPEDPRAPLLMVGAGTGVAAFRGFLHERLALRAQGRELGPATLIFGCRHPETDFLYRDELEKARSVADLTVAFSRLEGKSSYVQDHLHPGLIGPDVRVYICGDANRMAPAVRERLAELYPGDGEAWLEQLASAGRYRTDVWSSH